MNWLDTTQVSLYNSHSDNIGRAATMREVLLCPTLSDLETIVELRELNCPDPTTYKIQKRDLKARLQCYTPAALLRSKAKGNVIELSRTGLMQLDFDEASIGEFDIDELKACVFNLPFIAFCGLSASAKGFYALAMIAEPNRLAEYAEHCFAVLKHYGIEADTSKGKKPENLRYVSYDCDMLIRDNPEPLRIKNFHKEKKQERKPVPIRQPGTPGSNTLLINRQLTAIANAQVGQRWETVQKVAYTLGGIGEPTLIQAITSEIRANMAFSGEEDKYCKCAEHCFGEGLKRPLTTNPKYA